LSQNEALLSSHGKDPVKFDGKPFSKPAKRRKATKARPEPPVSGEREPFAADSLGTGSGETALTGNDDFDLDEFMDSQNQPVAAKSSSQEGTKGQKVFFPTGISDMVPHM
jgi:hypothetical protein